MNDMSRSAYPNVDLFGCRNARDLGGLPLSAGGRIRAGALIRSDSHHRMPDRAVAAVRATGFSRIVDLRWGWERREHPSPFEADARYRHVPMLDDVLPYRPDPDSYIPMIDHQGHRIAAAVEAFVDAPPGPVIVHCHSGKDRTGVLVAFLLKLAGVGDESVAADYALTPGCSLEPMRRTLTHLDRRYGGAAAYLATAGVSPGSLAAARERLS